jgi:hypothetical protein
MDPLQTTATTPSPLSFSSGEEVYDSIMAEIEPDLTHEQIPLLEEIYKDETPDEKEARSARYRQAFEEYDRRYATFELQLQANVRSFQIAAMKTAESSAHVQDEAGLAHIESTLSTLD